MEENVAINKQNKEYKLGGVTGKGFMPGVSGNPSGRPKGSMKDYLKRKFAEMSDEEKEQFLIENKVTGKDMIEFAEGKAKQDTETEVKGSLVIKLVNYNGDNNTAQLSAEELPAGVSESTTEVQD